MVEQFRRPPRHVREGVDQHPLVLLGVAVVEAGLLGAPVEEERARRPGIDGDRLAGRVVHEDVPAVPGRPVAERHRRDVQAHVTYEPALRRLRLLAEREAPRHRVQAVGPDHQIEAAWGGALEADLHPVLVLAERGDGVVEEELGAVAARLVEDRREVAARHLDLVRPLHGAHVHPADPPARRVDEADPRRAGGGLAQPGHDAHPLRDRDGRPPDVHRVAAGPEPSPALDHRDPEPVPGQPVGQRRPRDPGPRDQRCAHDAPPNRRDFLR
nr:hypothetical protein [Microbispora rosea]